MGNRLKDKVAIVTGAGSSGEGIGNGKATAILFAREGARALLADCNPEAAILTKRMIDEEEGESEVFEADVSRTKDCEAMVARCIELYGKVDILHNNVGIGWLGGAVETMEEDWDRIISVNLKSMFLTCKYVLPEMEKQGSGSVINVSSLASIRSGPYPQLAYSSSKGGVNSLTQSLAVQYARKGIRINAIVPGLIDTPLVQPLKALLGEEIMEARARAVPMGRQGEAWDVAMAALFLASDESKYITGAILPVDGGLSCWVK